MTPSAEEARPVVELITDPNLQDGLGGWRLDDTQRPHIRAGINFASRSTVYRIEGGSTGFVAHGRLADRLPAELVFHHPEWGAAIPAGAGEAFDFAGLFANHRCTCRIAFDFLDAQGSLIQRHEVAVKEMRSGGAGKVSDYRAAQGNWRAPPGSATAMLRVIKSPTARGTDSYMFFTRLSLRKTLRASPRMLVILPPLTTDGPVATLLEILEECLELGQRPLVATLGEAAPLAMMSRMSPIWLRDAEAAAALFADQSLDIVLATSRESIAPALAIGAATGATPVRLVWEDGEEAPDPRFKAWMAASPAIHEELKRLGLDATLLGPVVRMDLFHPHARHQDGVLRVLIREAEAEPASGLNAALQALLQSHLPIELGRIGAAGEAGQPMPFQARAFGSMTMHRLADALAWSDIYVDLSSQPAALEAMTSGSAVLLAQDGEGARLCQDGVNGLLVPTDDSKAIATALARLIADRRLRSKLCAEAITSVAAFGARHVAIEFLARCAGK